jgi:ribosomal protein S18 acetylase RimI-like enzyme
MTTRPTNGRMPVRDLDADAMRRLLLHEARVHAVPGRDLRDLGDAILLHDPLEPDPFWNRLEAVRWPDDATAFDRRLTEILVLFASIGRQPHVWASSLHDAPADLVARLLANGFRDMGAGNLMLLVDPSPALETTGRPLQTGVTVARLAGLRGRAAESATAAIVDVLLDAFDVDPERRPTIESETIASLDNPSFTHYLLRRDGRPAAVSRRATFESASYLSSIGTAGWARGQGYGSLVTSFAAADSLADASDRTYLGVFAENTEAIRVYDRAGFARVGDPCPDLLLI